MIRKLPEQEERVESGAVQFGNDWPGLFIRGDNAFAVAHAITNLLLLIPPDTPASMLISVSPLDWLRRTILDDVVLK